MPDYTKPDDDEPIYELVRDVIQDKFPDFNRMEPTLTIGLLWAKAKREGEPALRLHGYSALAIISVTSLEARALGVPDVVIRIDEDRFTDLKPRQQEATIAHELFHVTFPKITQLDGILHCATDSLERPKVTLRGHDWEIGGFTRVHEWYGQDAIEKRCLDRAVEELGQGAFEFMRSERTPVDLDTPKSGGQTEISFTGADIPRIREAAEVLKQRSRKTG